MTPDAGTFQVALSLALIVAAPGATTTAVTAISASLGLRQAAWAVLGIVCGDIGYLLLAASGASVSAKATHTWALLELFSALYLGQLSLRMLWTQMLVILRKREQAQDSISPALTRAGVCGPARAWAALKFHGLNPGAAYFFFSLVPALVPRSAGTAAMIEGCAILIAIHIGVACAVLAAYAMLGHVIRAAPGSGQWIAMLRVAMAVSVFAMAAQIMADLDVAVALALREETP